MADDDLVAIERAMVRIRRSQTRQALARRAEAEGAGMPAAPAALGVVDAVEQGPAPGGGEVSVREVAERLAVDPSRASRLAADAVRAGLLRRVAAQGDGRRTGLELTAAGRRMVADAHRMRQRRYRELTAGWSAAERAEFARLLTRFTDGLD